MPPTLTRPAPPAKLSSGELLERARKRAEWAAMSCRAATEDLTSAGQSGAQAVELAYALDALAQDIEQRRARLRR